MSLSLSTQVTPVAQVTPAAQTNPKSTTNVSTTITSTDPSVLQNQVSKLSSAVTQLKQNGGSSSQIQKLQLAEQTAKSQILKQKQLEATEKESEQSANIQTAVKESRGLDIQA